MSATEIRRLVLTLNERSNVLIRYDRNNFLSAGGFDMQTLAGVSVFLEPVSYFVSPSMDKGDLGSHDLT